MSPVRLLPPIVTTASSQLNNGKVVVPTPVTKHIIEVPLFE